MSITCDVVKKAVAGMKKRAQAIYDAKGNDIEIDCVPHAMAPAKYAWAPQWHLNGTTMAPGFYETFLICESAGPRLGLLLIREE